MKNRVSAGSRQTTEETENFADGVVSMAAVCSASTSAVAAAAEAQRLPAVVPTSASAPAPGRAGKRSPTLRSPVKNSSPPNFSAALATRSFVAPPPGKTDPSAAGAKMDEGLPDRNESEGVRVSADEGLPDFETTEPEGVPEKTDAVLQDTTEPTAAPVVDVAEVRGSKNVRDAAMEREGGRRSRLRCRCTSPCPRRPAMAWTWSG